MEGHYSQRWGKLPIPQVEGAALSAVCKLFEIEKDEKYIKIGLDFAKNIMSCQELNTAKNLPFGGFFYEDKEHKYLLTYDHRGHEQNAICGLVDLLKILKGDNKEIMQSIREYRNFILKSLDYTKPYDLLPAQVYSLSNINLDRFIVPKGLMSEEEMVKYLQDQIKTGIKLNDDLYLRRMAISPHRRGYHATLLSKTKAVSSIAEYLNDDELRQIAISQLEWVVGKNPFTTSTMYGEGYNSHPLYVAFSKQIVGGLPVGIMTYKNIDAPYWPVVNNAVYKEIWGHTTAKFLYVLADILKK
jgi:hypothetical protein